MDEERMNKMNREYTNGEITVFWKPSKCIHVTTCYRELIQVFNPRKRPWINMQGATTEEIIRVVDLCPTHALTYERNTKKKEIEKSQIKDVPDTSVKPAKAAELRVMKDGPLVVKGSFTITGSNGSVLKQMKMASFCRCGLSKNMPFCDGTHRKEGFSAD